MGQTPRVSILIPNFNNGRQSSRHQSRDFIDALLGSLVATLEDDPTPLEVLVHDDGSTDDSLATLRRWADCTWRGGQRVIDLVEGSHVGVLSVIANQLSRRAQGEFLVRLDGDIECLTPCWAQRLVRRFEQGPRDLGVIGPLQLNPQGRIHAFGDFVFHPLGYTHVATGWPAESVSEPLRVDHVMGCFYCCRRQVFEQLGGYDENILRGQTVDFGLRALLAGWQAWATPDIAFAHYHAERDWRETRADSLEGIFQTLATFRAKWGFDRLTPDLAQVQARYGGTPLTWNRRVFDRLMRWPEDGIESPHLSPPALAYREAVVLRTARALGRAARITVIGAGQGELAIRLARRGFQVDAVEWDPGALAHLAEATDRANPASERLRVAPPHQRDRLGLPAGQADLVVLSDVIERHPNPVAMLREAQRRLRAGGAAILMSRRRRRWIDDPTRPIRQSAPWTHEELLCDWSEFLSLCRCLAGWEPAMPVVDDLSRPDLTMVMQSTGPLPDDPAVDRYRCSAPPENPAP